MKLLDPAQFKHQGAILGASLLIAMGMAQAQERTALIIGISEYAPQVRAQTLAGVRHDLDSARKIASAMGVPSERMVFLRDDQATKSAILEKLRQMGADSPQGGRALVYFSGHGTRYFDASVGGCVEGLLTHDGQTITHQEFAQATQQLSQKADKVITLMDACHSGGVTAQNSRLRNVTGGDRLSVKFHLKSGEGSDQCSTPANMRTRSLLGEATRMGALQENFVQITSSLPDEVSFDEAGKGGLATQGLRDCLLGQAQDIDRSGAVSLEEIRLCAQNFVDQRLQNVTGLLPHHITVRGNRNLIPVAMTAAPSKLNEAESSSEVKPVALAPITTPNPAPAAIVATPPVLPQPASPAPAVEVPAQVASLSTLQDILAQRDPRRQVNITLDKKKLKIGRDVLQWRIRSSHAGHVHVVLLGSDAKSFYVLFPNGIDADNRIAAGQSLTLPRPHWQVQAAGPPGRDHVLVLVTEQPRSLEALKLAPASAENPFTYALNDGAGRTELIRFLVGSAATGRAESFGATLFSIEETP